MVYEKIHVGVLVEFYNSGSINPLVIYWENGQKIKIDKVLLRERAPCRSGGVLVERFLVKIQGEERIIYYDKEREIWFVEKLI